MVHLHAVSYLRYILLLYEYVVVSLIFVLPNV
jgi:hypothetical protein